MTVADLTALQMIHDLLTGELTVILFLCLSLGYMLGKVRIGSFTIGATLGTLVVGLLISQLHEYQFPPMVQNIFFILFAFTLGYEAGPAFFASLRSSGVKLVVLSAFFSAAALAVTAVVCKVFHFDVGTSLGLLAGAQTQSAVTNVVELGDDVASNITLSFGITYIFGTLGAILFVKNMAPALLRVSLTDEVKARSDALGTPAVETHAMPVQARAYVVEAASGYVGKTIDELERRYDGLLQIVLVIRGGKKLVISQATVLAAEDKITVVGSGERINHFDDDCLTEISDSECLSLELTSAKLIVTCRDSAEIVSQLSSGSVLVESVVRRGRMLGRVSLQDIRRGDILSVAGPSESVLRAAKALGYLKDEGDASDIPVVALALAVGVLIGALSIPMGSVAFTLNASGGALIAGMICGWYYQRAPRYGRIPDSTRWFLKSIGLNLFIAIKGLSTGSRFLEVFSARGATILLAGVIVTLLPYLLALFFGRKVLKLEPVDLLGGLCGSGTCTAALNELAEETGSSVFTAGYAPAYAVGNVLLILAGHIVALLMH